jgi:ubiquinone/menaquinone biosynthesis C-methylase UbiE
MVEHEHWQLDGSAPELYERYLVPAITSLWAADLVARATPGAGERILDLACGTGIVSRLAAQRMGSGLVVGLDINPGMLALARSLSLPAGAAIAWARGSALDIPFADTSFDAVLCQLGLQFFPNRQAALREMRRVLAPGGRLALGVFSAIEHTPAALALADALDRHVGAGASETKRSEHGLSDATELSALVGEAGFDDVTIQTRTETIRFPSPREYVRIQLAATPMAGLLHGMENEHKEAVVRAITRDMIASLPAELLRGGLTFPQEAHVVTARKPASIRP